jgi:hypothetical protein
MKNRLSSRFSRTEIGLAVASVCAMAFAGAAWAPTAVERASFSWSWGLAQNQTARLTVSNIGVENPTTPSDPCMAQLKVYGADGSVLVQSKEMKVAPGASAFQDLKFNDLVRTDATAAATDGTTPSRFQLRAEMFLVKVENSGRADHKAGCPSDSKLLNFSVEVFDNDSGRTSFSVPTDSFVPAVQ